MRFIILLLLMITLSNADFKEPLFENIDYSKISLEFQDDVKEIWERVRNININEKIENLDYRLKWILNIIVIFIVLMVLRYKHINTYRIYQKFKSINNRPSDYKAFLEIGDIYVKEIEYDKAIFFYQRSIELNPNHLKTYFNLAKVYIKDEQYNKAKESLRKAIEINPIQEYKNIFDYLDSVVIINQLVYQNQPFTKKYSFEKAKEYAKNLRLGGYDDWRLPTKRELKKLITKEKNKGKNGDYYIDKDFVNNLESFACFWTSKEKKSSTSLLINFHSGLETYYDKSDYWYVLCVR